MFPAFETLLLVDGIPQNIRYHENRMNLTRRELFGCKDEIAIDTIFSTNLPLARCKIIYNTEIIGVECKPYEKSKINSLKIIESNVEYSYKMLDRSKLDSIFALRGEADDVLISKNNMLCDTSVANIALFDGIKWCTPKSPLLRGTMCQKLLDDRFLVEEDIFTVEIVKYKKIAIMNALRGFEVLDIDLYNIKSSIS